MDTKSHEIIDLRTSPLYKEHAFHCSYKGTTDQKKTTIQNPIPTSSEANTSELKITNGLEVGSQEQMISAAFTAYQLNSPLNTLLTVRWSSLRAFDDTNELFLLNIPERIQNIVERLRTWLTRTEQRVPATYIWVREVSPNETEHWHIAFHLPNQLRRKLSNYIQKLLGEPKRERPRSQQERTRGEFACSEWSSWHLACEDPDGKPEFEGYWLAAYLGKGEPSQRLFRGKLVNNSRKPVRGALYGGRIHHDRYDAPQGSLGGTTTRKSRFDISRRLK
ncbi:MAG: hypothetical protein ABJQ23_09795 [Shimia thalassica]|uniref:rolling circle replication-associated protein n=1 Tax=Shimia thalassica TaxID=1715693 RepID=UPI0032994746